MIEVKNFSKSYSNFLAVSDISFTVEKGEILGFLGPNGAGKTTTMRAITGFIPPSSGSLRVCGFDVVENPLQVKRKIGYLPETPPLYNEMKVSKYIEYVAQIKDVPANSIKENTNYVIDVCSLSSVADRLIGNLSKGFRQRVGLAQALVHKPEVLVLDEPTSGLDPKQIIEIRNLIKKLAGDHTIILSTHILPEVTMTCGRVVIINEGKIVAIDHHSNLASRVKQNEKFELNVNNVDDNILKVVRSVPGVVSANGIDPHLISIEMDKDKDNRAEIIKSVVNSNYDVYEFKNVSLSLEDVFLKLTTVDEEVNS